MLSDEGLIVTAIEQLARAAALGGDLETSQGLRAEAEARRSANSRPRSALDRRDSAGPRQGEAHRTQ
jgi:hypothetical protein